MPDITSAALVFCHAVPHALRLYMSGTQTTKGTDMNIQTSTYPFTNRKDAIAFIKSHGNVDAQLITHGRGKYDVIIEEWTELSDDDATDMSEAFAADAEADEQPADDAEAHALRDAAFEEAALLTALAAARAAGDRTRRNQLITDARAWGIKGQTVADAAGVSLTYVYDIANGNVRTMPTTSRYDQGYAAGYEAAMTELSMIIGTGGKLGDVVNAIAAAQQKAA